jgi:hypothetical protein
MNGCLRDGGEACGWPGIERKAPDALTQPYLPNEPVLFVLINQLMSSAKTGSGK